MYLENFGGLKKYSNYIESIYFINLYFFNSSKIFFSLATCPKVEKSWKELLIFIFS